MVKKQQLVLVFSPIYTLTCFLLLTLTGLVEQAQSKYIWDINTNNNQNKIFKMARAIKDTNKDVTRERCVCDDKGNLTIRDEVNLQAWKEHYQRTPHKKNKPRFNRDKPCKLISNYWDLTEYNQGN